MTCYDLSTSNATPVSSNDGNGTDIRNRAPAPDNFEKMEKDCMNAVDPAVKEDYTRDAGISNPEATVSDETKHAAVHNTAPIPAPDPFAPENLKTRARNTGITIKKVLTNIPVKEKPGKQDFVRTRAGDEWQIETVVIEDEKNNNYYIVAPELHDHLARKGFYALLRLAVTRDGDPFLWVLKTPTTGASYEIWYESKLEVAAKAENEWVQLETTANCFCANVGEGIKAEPQWPELTFSAILRLCFKDRFIDSLDHPFLKRLRGEI